jgi:hypothetical protein
MPPKVRGGVRKSKGNIKANKSKSTAQLPGRTDRQMPEETDVESSDTPFTSISNMLPEDHPCYHHTNTLFSEFEKLSSAINGMKFNSEYSHGTMMEARSHLAQMIEVVKDAIDTHESS